MSKVHVILACFNGIEFIETQIRSVLKQVDTDVRIHAYDDCSTDGTLDYLQTLATADDRIFVYTASSASGSAFANFRRAVLSFSARLEPGDLVAFCDQDDIWVPTKLTRQIAAMQASGAVGCSTSVKAFYPDGRESYIDNAGTQTDYDFLFEGGGQGCTYLFEPIALDLLKRTLQASIDHSVEAVPHDWLLYALCRIKGLHWTILDEPLIKYRQHGSNAFGARSSFSGKMSRLSRLRSGHFARERERLCRLLSLSGTVNLSSIPKEFICKATGLERVIAGAKHLTSFRRTLGASIVVAMAYMCGKA